MVLTWCYSGAMTACGNARQGYGFAQKTNLDSAHVVEIQQEQNQQLFQYFYDRILDGLTG